MGSPAPDLAYGNWVVKLAADGKYSDTPIENLVDHVLQDARHERRLAIIALGFLQATPAIPVLAGLLGRCMHALGGDGTLDLPDSEKGAYPIGSEICEALARMDCEESHRLLVETATRKGNRWLRAAALDAMGYERNFQDEGLIKRFMSHRDWVFRQAAAYAAYECDGFRLAAYKPSVVPLLEDRSTRVVIVAVDYMMMLAHRDKGIRGLLTPLLKDKRYCPACRSTVAEYVARYLG